MLVHAQWLGGCKTECHDGWGDHVILGDEPESIGGTNEGSSPFVLLGMALASCTITTMYRVARDKGIELSAIEVDVSHKQNRLDETAESSYLVTCDLRMTAVRRRIVVKGQLSDEDVNALLWGAQHCPVSNTLMSGIPVKTEIKAAAPSEA